LIQNLLLAGIISLKEYIATHVLTCLVPAFLLAGGLVTFVNREAILKYLGEAAGKLRSFSLAGVSSFFLAACSCTVIPVASGLYYTGAGIGAAFIILWVAPASNILSLIYTGSILGTEMVIARVVAALAMALVVGLVMSFVFGESRQEVTAASAASSRVVIVARRDLVLLLLIVASLLLPNYLVRGGP